jgi:Rod binding domain-containing protein
MTTVLADTPAAPTAAELGDPMHAKAWQAARDFEAMALGQFLQPMFGSVDPSAGPLGGGAAEATWRPMLVDEVAKIAARQGGIGLATSVYRQMLREQERS